MSRFDVVCATLACIAKFALPPPCAHPPGAPGAPHGCAQAHLSHGRGSAGEFLPEAWPPFVMGAAAEVATRAR